MMPSVLFSQKKNRHMGTHMPVSVLLKVSAILSIRKDSGNAGFLRGSFLWRFPRRPPKPLGNRETGGSCVPGFCGGRKKEMRLDSGKVQPHLENRPHIVTQTLYGYTQMLFPHPDEKENRAEQSCALLYLLYLQISTFVNTPSLIVAFCLAEHLCQAVLF